MIFTLHFHQAMTAANNPDQPGARMPCETRKVFGFYVAVSSVEEMSSALAERALEAQAPCLVAAADAHVITLGVHDRGYGAVLERMDVVCPDGMPVVWKLNRGLPAGERSAERVSGPDLMEALVRANAEYPGLRHFLLGGDMDIQATHFRKIHPQRNHHYVKHLEPILKSNRSSPLQAIPHQSIHNLRSIHNL